MYHDEHSAHLCNCYPYFPHWTHVYTCTIDGCVRVGTVLVQLLVEVRLKERFKLPGVAQFRINTPRSVTSIGSRAYWVIWMPKYYLYLSHADCTVIAHWIMRLWNWFLSGNYKRFPSLLLFLLPVTEASICLHLEHTQWWSRVRRHA